MDSFVGRWSTEKMCLKRCIGEGFGDGEGGEEGEGYPE